MTIDAICLGHTADIREQLSIDDESMMTGSQIVVHYSLVMLLRMILEGLSIKDQLESIKDQLDVT